MRNVTRRQAEAALAALIRQFADYTEGGTNIPTLYEPGFHAEGWTIAWEGGYYYWPMIAFRGGQYDQGGTIPAVKAPAGIWWEPQNSWCLCLYPKD